jgi:hypothetical protein
MSDNVFYGFYAPDSEDWIDTKCSCDHSHDLCQSLVSRFDCVEFMDCYGEGMCPACDLEIWKREQLRSVHNIAHATNHNYLPRRLDLQISAIDFDRLGSN